MKVRLRFSKLGKVRFTSHRDVARMWERALRRAALPVARSQGFHPRPKLHFGLALSTGHESVAEYLDVDLLDDPSVEIERLPQLLSPLLPEGIATTGAGLLGVGIKSLQQSVTSCQWDIQVHGVNPEQLTEKISGLLAADELITTRERKGKSVIDDVRPQLHSLQVDPSTPSTVTALLGTAERGLRPSEFVDLLGGDGLLSRVCRTHQFTEHDGQLLEPLSAALEVAEFDAPHAVVRAS